MAREPWYESSNPTRVARGLGWRTAVALIAVVAFIGALGAGIWAIKVAVSGPKGAGDAQRITNSGRNRIAAQEAFEALYAQIQSYDRQLDQAAADKAEHPSDPFFVTNYSGLVKTCQDAVGQYNADARKVSREKWLTDDLPFQIDQTDPHFDCKENTTP